MRKAIATTTKQSIVVMAFEKSTKGTHVYRLDESLTTDKTPICTQVYLRRDALPDPAPATVQITISFEG